MVLTWVNHIRLRAYLVIRKLAHIVLHIVTILSTTVSVLYLIVWHYSVTVTQLAESICSHVNCHCSLHKSIMCCTCFNCPYLLYNLPILHLFRLDGKHSVCSWGCSRQPRAHISSANCAATESPDIIRHSATRVSNASENSQARCVRMSNGSHSRRHQSAEHGKNIVYYG